MIYFLCHSDPANYQWDIVPLAEGLTELGVPFCSSTNYWKRDDGTYLLPQSDDVSPLSCDAIVVSSGFLKWVKDDGRVENGALPEWLRNRGKNGPKVIGLDVCDGYLSPITTRWACYFDVILRAHFNRRLWWPKNVRPWAFGLTDRIIRTADKSRRLWAERSGCIFSFGASHGYPHGARLWARDKILPQLTEAMVIDHFKDDLRKSPPQPSDALLWRQCVGRHSPAYFKRLGSSQICAAFCGELVPGLPSQVTFLVGGNRAKIKKTLWEIVSYVMGLPPRNIQSDSWRFWEALGCGSAVLHYNAQQSGWEMPVMPENWKHYIGVDLVHPEKAIERVLNEPELLEKVARQGREWALEHYSPRKAAERLLIYAGLCPESVASPKAT